MFNGDIGYIADADPHAEELTVAFDDGREALYALADLEELELAYCMSVHKSQGSEFDCCLLYTSCTACFRRPSCATVRGTARRLRAWCPSRSSTIFTRRVSRRRI